MSNIQIRVSGADAAVIAPATLTAGMVGAAVTFTFSDSLWQDLTKIAVFRAGDIRRDVADWQDGVCAIPWECLRRSGETLLAGVYGADSTGAVVIPTVYADCGVIQPGADPAGDPAAQPTEPFFTALMEQTLARAKASGLFDGKDGRDGVDGQNGSDGQEGVSPTVTLQSTYAAGLIPATKVTITDRDGEHVFTVKDGKAGARGAAGVHGDSVEMSVYPVEGTTDHPNGGYQMDIYTTAYTASTPQGSMESESITLWHGNDGQADVSLGITGAAVGKTLRVAAVDANGAPTAWEVV